MSGLVRASARQNFDGDVGYVDRMRAKSPAKWGVHMAGMNFQTRSKVGRKSRKKKWESRESRKVGKELVKAGKGQ